MNNNYIPQPWHFVYALITFALGTACLLSERWTTLGYVCYALGIVITFVIVWASIWDVFVRKSDAIRFLFDSAKHLTDERVDHLLYAMGLNVRERFTSSTITANVQGHHGETTKTRILHNFPLSPEKLVSLAQVLITEKANFSRPEIVDLRKTLTDPEFRRTKQYMWDNKLIEMKNPSNANAGYRLTEGELGGVDIMTGVLPSPSPLMEVPQNQ